MNDAYWENGAYAEVCEEAGGYGYLLRFNGWHIQRRHMKPDEARDIHLHFLRSEAAFGPMSPEREQHIEEVTCSSIR